MKAVLYYMKNDKNIVILSSYSFLDGKATSNRIKIFAQELEKKDYIRNIVILALSHETEKEFNFSKKIKVKNILFREFNKNRFFIRALSELRISFILWKEGKKYNPDLLLISIPSLMLIVPSLFISKKFFTILDIRDVVWNYLPKKPFLFVLKKIIEIFFAIVSRKFSLITVTNVHEAELIKKISSKEILVVPNGISLQRVEELSQISFSKLNTKINLTYVGNVGIAQELEILIKFAKANFDINITIVGSGARTEYIRELIEFNNLKNIKLKKQVAFEELIKFYSMSDILFAQIGKDYVSAIPTKIFEYIAAGRRVLLGLPNEGIAKNMFSSFDGVEIFKSGDIDDMFTAYRNLLNNKFSKKDIANNLIKLKLEHLRENHTNLMIKSIDKIV